jgi:hypothetical protein
VIAVTGRRAFVALHAAAVRSWIVFAIVLEEGRLVAS